MTPAELVLHPVRLRIVQAFLGGRILTTSQLAAELPDVPTATLYRQVATLADGGLLEVVEERRVRGASERTYRLPPGAGSIEADQARTMGREEHRRGFLTFVAGLVADFERYLARPDVDLGRDLVGYRQAAMYLTDEETLALLRDLGEVLLPRLTLPPAPARTRRILSTAFLPAP